MKLTFVNPPHADWCLANMATWIFLQSHLARTKFGDLLEWVTPPIKFNSYSDVTEIVNEIESCDVVLFSSYVWNYDLCDEIAMQLKRRHPEKVVILGGPHIGLNDLDFFTSRPKYDYVCRPTKPGEVFIESLVSLYFQNESWPNPDQVEWEIHSNHGKSFPLPDYSVYREHLSYLKEIRDYAREFQLEPFIVVETTRGCPYTCVYCEWGGGTNSKIVQKPLNIVKEDILALSEAGFNSAYLTDANFGVFESRDLEIFKFAYDLSFALTDISTVKSKSLEKRKRLVDLWFGVVGSDKSMRFKEDKTVRTKSNLNGDTEFLASAPTVSIQSISEEAMAVAMRSDLSFNDKISLSEHIRSRSEREGYKVPPLELILAMPGSTLKDFYNEFEIIWNFKAWSSFRHDYMFLPDTQTSNSSYLEKYKIKLVKVYSDLIDEAGVDNQFTLYANKRTYFNTICECYSYTHEEFKEMFFMNSAGNYLLEHLYPRFQESLAPSEFGKMSYEIIEMLDEFAVFKAEIDDIFDVKSAPRSIKKLLGRLRTESIREFLIKNQAIIVNEIFIRIGNYGNNRTITRAKERPVLQARPTGQCLQ